MRQHISQSKRDQASYLKQVDRASAIERKEKRKRENEEQGDEKVQAQESRLHKGPKFDTATLQENAQKAREFRQRRPMQRDKSKSDTPDTNQNKQTSSKTLQNVLALL